MARKTGPPKKTKKSVKKIVTNSEQNIFNFLKKSYDESMSLLIFSRDYFSARGQADRSALSGRDSLAYTLAMSTITSQLTSVTAWLLMCRAVQNGEITIEELKSEDFKMPEFNLNIETGDSCFANLNNTVLSLMKKSSELYNRIKRMENSIQSQILQ